MQMGPKTSLWDVFTNEGRLKRLWTQALAETDPITSISQMREVLHKLLGNPVELVHLWLPFLDTLLDGKRVRLLSKEDLETVERMGSVLSKDASSQVRPEEIWFRVLQAYNVRTEEQAARLLLLHIYTSPSVTWEEKTRCVRELAYRGGTDDIFLKIYIEYLHSVANPGLETPILAILHATCQVNFDTEPLRLTRAKEVAQRLVNNSSIPVVGLWTVLGLYSLLIQREVAEAARCFSKALDGNGKDETAFIGLISAWIQLDMHDKAVEVVRLPQHVDYMRNDIIIGLVKLSNMKRWLDSRDMPGTMPGDVQSIQYLKNLNLRKYVGDLADVTLGRVCLVIGNAHGANEMLKPVIAKNVHQPQWSYYAAWASMLTGDKEGVAVCFTSSMAWSALWTVACLLLDADPVVAERYGIQAFLRNTTAAQVNQTFLPLIEARLALVQSMQPATVTWKAGLGCIEEDMEALRTVLGVMLYQRNVAAMERLLAHPLIYRLPFAEQLLWRGLFALHTKAHVPQGLELLDKAVTKCGYSRAAMVLWSYYLENNNIQMAKHYFAIVAPLRQDSKVWLLQAYMSVREGQLDEAIGQLEKVTKQPQCTAKVHYALGNLYLQKAAKVEQDELSSRYREKAARILNAALTKGRLELPNDATALVHCTQFVAYPQQRKQLYTTLWSDLERLEPYQRQHWFKWNATLAQIWYGSATEVIRAAAEITTIIESANRIGEDATVEVFAQALAQVSKRVERGGQVEPLVAMLERLSLRSELQTVKRSCRVGITLALQARYQQADAQQRTQARQELMRAAYQDSSNEMLALFLASVSLENAAQRAAVTVLRNVQTHDRQLQHIFTFLATLLDKQAPEARTIPKAVATTPTALKLGYDLLQVAATFASHTPDKGYEVLNMLLRQYPNEIASYINIEHILPSFCAYLMKGGAAPPVIVDVIRNLSQGKLSSTQAVMLARCTTAIGELDAACRIWEQALAHDASPTSPLRQEYAKLLCHLAVVAHLAGNDQDAIHRLRQASEWQERSVVQ